MEAIEQANKLENDWKNYEDALRKKVKTEKPLGVLGKGVAEHVLDSLLKIRSSDLESSLRFLHL